MELAGELGSDAYGLVLRAYLADPGREVAVRVLSCTANAATAETLTEALLRLEHPHLARTYSVVTTGSLCLVVSELLGGSSLGGRRDLAGPAACAAVAAVADGLAAAHAAGILHRNVTPSAVFLAADGHPVLIGLGVAALAGDSVDGLTFGSPEYLAPEQIIDGSLSPATDVYALGATLYTLFVGGPVFGDGLTVAERLRHHCEVVPVLPPVLPPSVAVVVGRALAKVPADRYAGAAEFAAALAGAAGADYGPDWREPFGPFVELPSGAGATAATGTSEDCAVDPGDVTSPLSLHAVALPPPPDIVSVSSPPAPPSVPATPTAPAASPVSGMPVSTRRRVLPRWAVPLVAALASAALAVAVVLPLALTRAGSSPATSPSGPAGATAPPSPVYGTAPVAPAAPRFSVDTVAGNGKAGYAGDGGRAAVAELNQPFGVTVDSAGDVFVPDYGSSVVRRVGPDGTITTVAGNGKQGFSGDGGPATAAELFAPTGVAVDAAGNLYISDFGNNRIRRVAPSGIITTFAGNGSTGPGTKLGDLLEPFTPDFGDGGPATKATLFGPIGLAFDRVGDLLVADSGDNRVRMISPAGIISTVAGGYGWGSYGDGGRAVDALLASPWDVAVDQAGRIYIAESGGRRVRRIDRDGTIETIAGTGVAGYSGDGGPATAATFRDLTGVAVDAAGDVFVVEHYNHRIREVTAGGTVFTVAGSLSPGPSSAALNGIEPYGAITVDSSGQVLYVADRAHSRVIRVALGR